MLDTIKRSFPPRTIIARGAFTQRGRTYPDAIPYEQALESRSWLELDHDYLARRTDALSFLSDPHLLEVLPLYLQLLVTEPSAPPVAETLLPLLTRDDTRSKLHEERFEALLRASNDEQKATIAKVLRHVAANATDSNVARAADAALRSYWDAHET